MSNILKGILNESNPFYGHNDPAKEYGADAPTYRKRGPYSHTDDDEDVNPFAEYERQQKDFAIGRAKKAAAEKQQRDSDHDRLASGTNESMDDPWGPQGNFAGDTPVNLGGVSMKIIQVGDTVKYFGYPAKVVDMSKDRKYSRITITKGMGSVTQDVLTSDLQQLGRGKEVREDNNTRMKMDQYYELADAIQEKLRNAIQFGDKELIKKLNKEREELDARVKQHGLMPESEQLDEISNEKLAQYKTAAAADAGKADSEGDYKRGDKRFSGIVRATKKQFANDAKKSAISQGINEFSVNPTGPKGPKDYGQPNSSRYIGGNKFVVGTTNNYVLTATIDKWGLEWDEDDEVWFLDSPGAAHIADASEGEIELPPPREQRYQIHDLVTDYLNSKNLADLQKVAKYYGHSDDGEMATNEEYRPTTGQANNIRKQTAQKMNPGSSKFVWKRPNQISGSHTEQELLSMGFRKSTKSNVWGGTQDMWNRLSESLYEFAPNNDDDDSDDYQMLRKLASQWYNGSDDQMLKIEHVLSTMGWEIGEDESGEPDAGVFVIRTGDINGDTYIAFPESELNLNENLGDQLKSTSLDALIQAKLAIEKQREADIEAWRQDFEKNTVQKAQQGLRRQFEPTPVSQPGEKHSVLKNRLMQLNSAIEKQEIVDKLVDRLERKGLMTPAMKNDTDTRMHVRYGAKDNYQSLNQKLDNAINMLKHRLAMRKISGLKESNDEEQLDELSCWSGYHRVAGTKAGFPGSCEKNKTNEDHTEKCPHCGGELVSEELMNEKKDACYYKVKSRYKVWPSAYASGALVKCRKSHGSWGNGGKKNESSILEGIERADENLHQWFKEKWVRFGPDGKIRGDCARGDDSEGKPKCLPQSKAQNLGKKGRASAAARKRREDPNPERSGKAINVNTKKKSNEGVAEGSNAGDIELSHSMSPDMLYVHATSDGTDVGGARFKKIDGAWTGDIVHVYPQFRRQGIATKIYDYAEDLVGKIIPSKTLKPKGKKFWDNRDNQGVAEEQLDEKWSQKYKDSINCSNPKGFSQKAHCAGKKK